MAIAIGLDIGTSGIRTQAIELETKKVLSTAITLRHPLPGSNVIDHLDFCLNNGRGAGHNIVVRAVDSVIRSLDVELDHVERIAACGNPIQMSIFQNIEIRDLAFGGENTLKRLGLTRPERKAAILDAGKIGLESVKPSTQVCIPPAVAHMIGADAIAMIFKSGMLDRRETALVTDYGTNAEIGLKVGDEIYTGSAAAGPAIEGQEIGKGMLASPGAISDINAVEGGLLITVLDNAMMGQHAYTLDQNTWRIIRRRADYVEPKGLTGTGTIALVYTGMRAGFIKLPKIATADSKIHLFNGEIDFNEKDLCEVGKAFGAFRAGHLTLLNHVGLKMSDIHTAYMAGAGGTYVDPIKAQGVGLVPPNVKDIYQVGNTSLAFACDIAKDLSVIDSAQDIADRLKGTHVLFPVEEAFKNAYICELGFWEGISMDDYKMFLNMYQLPEYPECTVTPSIHKVVARDIPNLGSKGLHIVSDIGTTMTATFDRCTGCRSCEKACIEKALKVEEKGGGFTATIRTECCDGVACKKCAAACPDKVYDYSKFVVEGS
ncbi:MAG TPA: methylamine methyltransferase corrinoid protein reductive activase [Candidatus Methanomethylicus sp.]|nr:methylamine methyltransferase corrinoid protein reductive activase [Candidatus Methanomethylicus sp.]HRR54184.1 methylamine methyltransferase corrinoid protein reductive activase [Candidatus Methanomethylicus sp.]